MENLVISPPGIKQISKYYIGIALFNSKYCGQIKDTWNIFVEYINKMSDIYSD